MEIGSFTYRFLCRNTSESQLLKYQHHKENVSQLLYNFLKLIAVSLRKYSENGEEEKDRAAADVPFSGTVCKGKGKNLGGGWRCVK